MLPPSSANACTGESTRADRVAGTRPVQSARRRQWRPPVPRPDAGTVKVHHLNCGTMRPPLTPELVCHVLLVEGPTGLVLVDSGFGLEDVRDPAGRLGSSRRLVRPVLDPEETALRQVEGLGFSPHDVKAIVLTHFDSDHVGGLADFPRRDRARHAPTSSAPPSRPGPVPSGTATAPRSGRTPRRSSSTPLPRVTRGGASRPWSSTASPPASC